jgi:hypothetical protein
MIQFSGYSEGFGMGEASNFGIGEQWIDHAIFHPQCRNETKYYEDMEMWGCDYATNCLKDLGCWIEAACDEPKTSLWKKNNLTARHPDALDTDPRFTVGSTKHMR